MLEKNKENLKLKQFLEVTFRKITDNKIPLFEIEEVLKKSFEYLDENLDTLVNRAKKELDTVILEELDAENIKNMTNMNEHFQVVYAFMKANFKNSLVIQKKSKSSPTFAIPTTAEMFGILPMFAGKPQRLSKSISKLLGKNKDERTSEEQDEVDKFVESVFKIEKETSYAEGQEIFREKGIILVCDNPIVQAKAEAPSNYIDKREGLITYIKSAYGVEGLRHLLAILVGLEENGRKGTFKLSINDHLDRLGYKKGPNRTHKTENKKMAAEIIYILSSLYVTIIKKKANNKTTIEALKLFNLEGFKLDMDRSEIMNSEFYISTTEWYKEAFLNQNNEFPKYTKMLKIITHENHLHHSLTIYLTTILSVFLRIQNKFEITVSKLMEWCDIDSNDTKNRIRELKKMEDELNYMKEKKYIGTWEVKNETVAPSKCKYPFEAILVIYPPDWLNDKLQEIQDLKENYELIANSELIDIDQFLEIFEKSKLTIKDFCEKINISPRMFHMIKKGERNISQKISESIIKAFY